MKRIIHDLKKPLSQAYMLLEYIEQNSQAEDLKELLYSSFQEKKIYFLSLKEKGFKNFSPIKKLFTEIFTTIEIFIEDISIKNNLETNQEKLSEYKLQFKDYLSKIKTISSNESYLEK